LRGGGTQQNFAGVYRWYENGKKRKEFTTSKPKGEKESAREAKGQIGKRENEVGRKREDALKFSKEVKGLKERSLNTLILIVHLAGKDKLLGGTKGVAPDGKNVFRGQRL